MEHFRKYGLYIMALLLLSLTIGIWSYVYTISHQNHYLKVAFLDIGQGDSIYIEAPNGRQMLVDGGPDSTVLSRLGKVMPFGDRSIDVVLATHTDADHIAGLSNVIDHYKVSAIIENGIAGKTQTFQTLQQEVQKYAIKKVIARRGMRIVLDQKAGVYFDILFPDRDMSNATSNDGSIVGKLTYGTESFMLTGDATKFSELLIMQHGNIETLHAQVLKLGHHGSKTASSELWLEAVHPDVAIISAGLHNRYGLPSQEILDRLDALHIPYLATYKQGTILFKTDGVSLWH
jgi:competence protein ComEC